MSHSATSSITAIVLDVTTLLHPLPAIQQERDIAVADLVAESQLKVVDHEEEGPYMLYFSAASTTLTIAVYTARKKLLAKITVPLLPLRPLIKDYFLICESYNRAVAEQHHSRIEAIDMGRRSIHNEAAAILTDLLDTKVLFDFSTARKLFTLIAILHMR